MLNPKNLDAEMRWQRKQTAEALRLIDLMPLVEELERPQAQEWQADLSGAIDYMIPFPGLAQDIQKWILETSVKPQPALAFAATLAVLSVTMGRTVQVEGIKGNLLFLCLAESGEGKDWPMKSCRKLLDSVGMGNAVYGDMASGAALVAALEESPSCLLQIDEAGHYFASINSKTSNQYSREILPIITQVYTSAADCYTAKKLKSKEGAKIVEPNLSMMGMSTERQIIDTLKTSEIADGSIARFFVIFGNNNVAINRNRKSNASVPDSIKSRLEMLKGGQFMLSSTDLVLNNDYHAAKVDLEDKFNQAAIELGKSHGEKAIFKPLKYRTAVRSIQVALLLDQCYSLEVLNWAADIVDRSCDIFIKKFCHLSSDNDNERYVKIIERAIKEAGTKGITKERFYDKTRAVDSGLKKRILADLFESNKIFTNESEDIKPGPKALLYFWRK